MAIKMSSDIGAPLTVMAVNVVGRSVFPAYHDWLVYAMSVAGYLGAWMGWGGDFMKNIGVASLPLTAEKIYDRVAGTITPPVTKRLGMKSIARYPAPARDEQFAGVRLV
ncbi:hypothetical protein LCGC14_1883140 [marine sediment metagenome]|uniref:Uncharacterized protein n=1 Tax=marine sediment metagenome TaxID=412755 RepID=A0A0F9GPZ4_9ZZZZ